MRLGNVARGGEATREARAERVKGGAAVGVAAAHAHADLPAAEVALHSFMIGTLVLDVAGAYPPFHALAVEGVHRGWPVAVA